MKKILVTLIMFLFLPVFNVYANGSTIKTSTATVSVSVDNLVNVSIDTKQTIAQQIVDIIGGKSNDPKIKIVDPEENILLEQNVIEDTNISLEGKMSIPGEYKVNINNQEVTKFLWGVLVINTNKNIYEPNETAYIQIASLDKNGHTLCDSNLELKIDNQIIPVQKNNSCGIDNVTDLPDYFAYYKTGTTGAKKIILKNLDNNYQTTSSLIVKEDVPFVIERIGATRINPFKSDYQMIIKITSSENFNGTIIETLPDGFELIESNTNWDVNLVAGKEKTFKYLYRATKISPEIFSLGPLNIGDYSESRNWILASDAPSLVVDATSSNPNAFGFQRRVIRTTYGANGKRTFVLTHNGSNLILYYSDDPEASSPTWTSVGNITTLPSGDMVWDETNNVIYIAYGLMSVLNSNASDIRYKLISTLSTTPTIGTERIPLDGVAGGTTYNSPAVEIAGDSGTTKVFLFGSKGTAGGNPEGVSVAVGTINSDNPTWGTFDAKTWTTTASSGFYGVSRMNTDKLVVQYCGWNDTDLDIYATRHDDSSDAEATSGWDALDGTDNSQTTISTDACGSAGQGSVVGMPASDVVWFSWFDSAADINTIRWNGTGLDTEMVPLNFDIGSVGESLISDGVTLWLVSRNDSDNTQVVFQSRSATDGTTAWSGTKYVLDDLTEIVNTPLASKKIYQGKLDIVYTTATNNYVRHASSYKISGNIYQEAAGSPYEGTTVWSGCDGSTLNVAVSVNGGTKQNTWCSASDGSYYFVLIQPTESDQDITVFLDTGGGNKGTLFTHNNDAITDITGLTLYKDKVIIRSESSSSITNADINTYDQTNDADIPIASDGTNATVDSGFELHINSGETYAPGGNVTTPKLHLIGTYTGASETLTLNGSGSSSSCDNTVASLRPLCIDGGTFTPSSNTTLFSGATASLIQNATYNILRIEPGGNSITHTLMAGTTTAGGNLTIGNGTNTLVTVTAATNSTTLTANANLTISANTTFIANGSNTTTVKGNWANSGAFTHSSGTVDLDGTDSSTQALTGNTTFNNFSASTSGNSAGRTLQFAGSSTNTVVGTWTVTGFSGKVITLQSSDTNAWTINPTAASVTYVSVSRSTNTGTSFCATYSTDGLNNTGWNISGTGSCGGTNSGSQFKGINIKGLNLE